MKTPFEIVGEQMDTIYRAIKQEPFFKKSPEPDLPCQHCRKIDCSCDADRKQLEEDMERSYELNKFQHEPSTE